VNPRSKPGNSGDKTQSIRKSLSGGEIPIEAESRLATKVTVRFWGCWWFRKVDPGVCNWYERMADFGDVWVYDRDGQREVGSEAEITGEMVSVPVGG
jgi:hypothetical protein